jgi:hypothetical protein
VRVLAGRRAAGQRGVDETKVRPASTLVSTQTTPSAAACCREYGATTSSLRTPGGAATTGMARSAAYRATHAR